MSLMNATIFIEENYVRNVVCKMAIMLSRSQCVNRIENQGHGNFETIYKGQYKEYLHNTSILFAWI